MAARVTDRKIRFARQRQGCNEGGRRRNQTVWYQGLQVCRAICTRTQCSVSAVRAKAYGTSAINLEPGFRKATISGGLAPRQEERRLAGLEIPQSEASSNQRDDEKLAQCGTVTGVP